MYKIIFIDEVEADIHRFQRYILKKDINNEFKVIGKEPMESIDELLEYIFSEKVDAVISDFQLSEYKSSITYTGVDLLEKLLLQKKRFPCFVMTSYDDQAVATSTDVNIVYVKGLMNKEDNVKITFLERIKNQINHYKKIISVSQTKFNALVEKSNSQNLTAKEEEKLLELDAFLESALNQESKIPNKLKQSSTLDDLHKLIENTDVLLKKMEQDSE